jgi:hypothetical protein
MKNRSKPRPPGRSLEKAVFPLRRLSQATPGLSWKKLLKGRSAVGIFTAPPVFVISDAVHAFQASLNFTLVGTPVTFLPLPLLQSFIPGSVSAALTQQGNASGQNQPGYLYKHPDPFLP